MSDKEQILQANADWKAECAHIDSLSGECLYFKETCFYDEPNKCPEYGPKWTSKTPIIQRENKK